QYSDQDVSSPLALSPFPACPPRGRSDDKTEQAHGQQRSAARRRGQRPCGRTKARVPRACRTRKGTRETRGASQDRTDEGRDPAKGRVNKSGGTADRRKSPAGGKEARRTPAGVPAKRSRAAHREWKVRRRKGTSAPSIRPPRGRQ